MVKDNLNTSPHFPYTYGDNPTDDDVRLSIFVSELMKNKKFQYYARAVFVAVIALGSCAAPSVAIPAEYGEIANNVNEHVQQDLPPIGNGRIGQGGRGNLNLGPKNPGLPQGQGIPQLGPPGPVAPVPREPVYIPLIPPIVACERIINTKAWSVGGVLALGWVCFTAYATQDRGLAGVCAGLFFYAIGKK